MLGFLKTNKRAAILVSCLVVIVIAACNCSGSKSKKEDSAPHEDEWKELSTREVTFKGPHADLFRVDGEQFKVGLVKGKEDWEVRFKLSITTGVPFNDLSDSKKWEKELSNDARFELINASEVEVCSMVVNESELTPILTSTSPRSIDIMGKSYDFEHYTYTEAKEIFDKVNGIVISNIRLKEAANTSSATSNDDDEEELFDDMDDLDDAIDAVGDLLELEGKAIGLLKGL